MTRMDEAAKRRLVGAAVLVALAVIFVPMLVEEGDEGVGEPIVIPDAPDVDGMLGRDADWSGADSTLDQPPLPEPNDLPMPLPIPEPPQSAFDADPAPTGDRSARQSGASASSARPGSSDQSASTPKTPTQQGRRDSAEMVPAGPKPVPPGTNAWVIQVASLVSPEAARTLQDELRAKGYPAFVEQADVNGRRYYRVRIGPEVERTRADRLAERLAADRGGKPLVQRYP